MAPGADSRIIATSMRCVVSWIAACGVWWFTAAAGAQPPAVEWHAPAGCPDTRVIDRMVERSIDPDSQPAIRHARAEITRVLGGYEMMLVLHTEAATHEKRFVAELCSTLVELLSLELGFSSWSLEAQPPEEPSRTRLRWGLHLSGDVRTSPMPAPSGALSLGLLVSRARLRAELRASYGILREVRYRMPRSVGGRFESFAAEARACYALAAGMLAIPLCAGAEIGALRAQGLGVAPALSMTTQAIDPATPRAVALAPHLTIAGASQAIAFYERAFGARLGYVQKTPDGRVMHADLELPNGGVFFLNDDFPEHGGSRAPGAVPSPVTIHLELDDVDAVWKQAVAAGACVEMPLADQFWGARYGVLRDPFGHRWSLAKQIRQPSPAELDSAAKNFGR